MRKSIILASALLLALSGPALAAKNAIGNGNGKGSGGGLSIAANDNKGNRGNSGNRGGRGGGEPADRVLDVLVTAAEIAIFKDYLDLPGIPGYMSNPKPLPPGIAMNLRRGKPLPPGIAKRYGLPGDLLGRLPRRDGYDWVVMGASILLVESATQVIAEVLDGILRPNRGGY